jgi:hypothetical protein
MGRKELDQFRLGAKANCSDDPTRGAPLRLPRPPAPWMARYLRKEKHFFGTQGSKISLHAFGASRDPRVGHKLGDALALPVWIGAGETPEALRVALGDDLLRGREVVDPTKPGGPGRTHATWASQWRHLCADIANGLGNLFVCNLRDPIDLVPSRRPVCLPRAKPPTLSDPMLGWLSHDLLNSQEEVADFAARQMYWLEEFRKEDLCASEDFRRILIHTLHLVDRMRGKWIILSSCSLETLLANEPIGNVTMIKLWIVRNTVIGIEEVRAGEPARVLPEGNVANTISIGSRRSSFVARCPIHCDTMPCGVKVASPSPDRPEPVPVHQDAEYLYLLSHSSCIKHVLSAFRLKHIAGAVAT